MARMRIMDKKSRDIASLCPYNNGRFARTETDVLHELHSEFTDVKGCCAKNNKEMKYDRPKAV